MFKVPMWVDKLSFIILVSLVLIIFHFFLPIQLREKMVLDVRQQTLISIFFSNYLHADVEHLIVNVLPYIFLMIFTLETDKKRFYSISIVNLLIVPIIASLVVLFLDSGKIETYEGFSAVLFAFGGYMIYGLCAYLKKSFNFMMRYSFMAILILNFLIWYSVTLYGFYILVALFILSLIFLILFWSFNKRILGKIGKGMALFVSFSFLLAICILYAALSKSIVTSGQIVTDAHLAGCVSGLISPFIYDNF